MLENENRSLLNLLYEFVLMIPIRFIIITVSLYATVNCLIKRLNMTNDIKLIYSRVTNQFQFQWSIFHSHQLISDPFISWHPTFLYFYPGCTLLLPCAPDLVSGFSGLLLVYQISFLQVSAARPVVSALVSTSGWATSDSGPAWLRIKHRRSLRNVAQKFQTRKKKITFSFLKPH